MNTHPSCIVCILNQQERIAGMLELPEEQKSAMIAAAQRAAAAINPFSMTAPQFSARLYRAAAAISGEPDPYRSMRRRHNDMILALLPELRAKINASPDPLFTAGYFSLLGNIIDYGGVHVFAESALMAGLNNPVPHIDVNDYTIFRERLSHCERVLILGDNAGEGVFDLLFIEQIARFRPQARIFYGVRSHPAINDMLMEDADYIGISSVARLLETGSDCAGTIVSESDSHFRAIYADADLIISKGQGNFETLEEEPENILFIFKVKCPVVAHYVSLPEGSTVFAFRERLTPRRNAVQNITD